MSPIADLYETMEYGPAPENASESWAWLERHEQSFGHLILGEWRRSGAGERFLTHNPATGEELATIAQGSPEDVDAAVQAARRALGPWRKLGPHGRARYLYAMARLLQKHAREFAVLESLDNGKPIRESRDLDVPLAARHFYHHAGWAHLLEREFPGYRDVGVIGQIIPWNFPLLMLAWKVAPALAAGNTVVLKPAELTPLTALRFAELVRGAGLPPGVFNLVTGDGRTGAALVEHPGVDKIAFTGSTGVGRTIREATAGSGKRLSLELGGKSPFIVFDDADLDSAVEGVVDGIWLNQGEVCCAGSRLLVQESVAERLIAKLRARMETLRIGDPLEKAIDIGAISAPQQLDRIDRLVRRGQEEGGTMWQPSWSKPERGCFYPPTLFTDVSPAATLAQEEIFGPVVVTMSFRTPKEAVELANNTRYGLAASVWSESVNLALQVASTVRAGTVWINSANVFDAAAGFGGYRESGFGREGGREGMYEYLRPEWEGGLKEVDDSWREDRAAPADPPGTGSPPPIDRTAKMYVGGVQKRPDGEHSIVVADARGRRAGEVGKGSRKDIRDAVEAARGAQPKWAGRSAHNRAQILYYLAENLDMRREELSDRIRRLSGARRSTAQREVELAIRRLYSYAGWADKFDGAVHRTPMRTMTLAIPEPVGVLGIVCPDDAPLLGLVSTVAPAIATGNAVVVVPSERYPLVATDLYQVLDTSDVPPGAVNIVTGERDPLAEVLAAHDDVDGLWYFGSRDGSAVVERLAAGNMKRTWVNLGRDLDWRDERKGEGEHFLRHATEIKNIWIPYGE